MKSVLGIFLMTFISLVNTKLTPPTPTTAQMFPYHAVIDTNQHWCNGALISKNFILTRATCIDNGIVEQIYLGFSRNPSYEHNRNDPNGQIFTAQEIYIHEDFGYQINNDQSVYNLALIKLDRNIVPSNAVKPIPMASREDFPIPPGTYLNQTGYLNYSIDSELHYATVRENKIDYCYVSYGNSFLLSQERCVQQSGLARNEWVGPYVVNGVLVGLAKSMQASATCHVTSPPCSIYDVYISIESSLLWIYRISGVAGVKSREQFSKDNPYWVESEAEECPPTDSTLFDINNSASLAKIVSDGIYLGAKNIYCD